MPDTVYVDLNEAILRNTGKNKIVLDVGCGSGFMSKTLKDRNNIIWGIDQSEDNLIIARKYLDKTIRLDIENKRAELPKNFFDIIILADILEHIRNPENILVQFNKFLKRDGVVIISIPNIANWSIRLKLLFGNFDYSDTGILDKTHLHFYTFKTIKRLVKKCGYSIVKVDVNPNFIRFFLPVIKRVFSYGKHDPQHSVISDMFESKTYNIYKMYILPIELMVCKLWKSLFAYQFIFVVKPGK